MSGCPVSDVFFMIIIFMYVAGSVCAPEWEKSNVVLLWANSL